LRCLSSPAGTVTLVFTDIEGSARLLEELGEQAYREAPVGTPDRDPQGARAHY
jgi:class 3 adenylate cyclase